ncbi:hypothetical protein EJB05_34875, partial [Eragrostis curvula]
MPVRLGWRVMYAAGVLPPLFLGVGMLAMPKSPRWLAIRERHTDTPAVLVPRAHLGHPGRGRPLPRGDQARHCQQRPAAAASGKTGKSCFSTRRRACTASSPVSSGSTSYSKPPASTRSCCTAFAPATSFVTSEGPLGSSTPPPLLTSTPSECPRRSAQPQLRRRITNLVQIHTDLGFFGASGGRVCWQSRGQGSKNDKMHEGLQVLSGTLLFRISEFAFGLSGDTQANQLFPSGTRPRTYRATYKYKGYPRVSFTPIFHPTDQLSALEGLEPRVRLRPAVGQTRYRPEGNRLKTLKERLRYIPERHRALAVTSTPAAMDATAAGVA